MAESPSLDEPEEIHMSGHDHEAMMDSGQNQAMVDAHDHGSEGCDDHCMNCSTHYSSAAIINSSVSIFESSRKFIRTLTGDISSRPNLLYRPPIYA